MASIRVRYVFEGQEHEHHFNLGNIFRPTFSVGQPVSVFLDPKHPERFAVLEACPCDILGDRPPVVPLALTPPPPPVPTAPLVPSVCPVCRAPAEPESAFCDQCGEKLIRD